MTPVEPQAPVPVLIVKTFVPLATPMLAVQKPEEIVGAVEDAQRVAKLMLAKVHVPPGATAPTMPLRSVTTFAGVVAIG